MTPAFLIPHQGHEKYQPTCQILTLKYNLII